MDGLESEKKPMGIQVEEGDQGFEFDDVKRDVDK